MQKMQETRVPSWLGKIPWSRKWQPTPVFLPGESHRQRSPMGYSPPGHIVLDTTEHTYTHSISPLYFINKHGDSCSWVTNTETRKTSVPFSSVTQSCPTLCDLMDCSRPGFPVHHQLPELTQIHVHHISEAIQPSHPLLSPSPPTFNLS